MLKNLVAILFLSFLFSCNSKDEKKFYGVDFDTTSAITVSELQSKMIGLQKTEAVVRGKISAVCQAEGCWMNLENLAGEIIFVDWNHEFTIPKNAAGEVVYVTGTAFFDTTSVDDLRHFAEDAGKSKEEIDLITEPKYQLAIKARGLRF